MLLEYVFYCRVIPTRRGRRGNHCFTCSREKLQEVEPKKQNQLKRERKGKEEIRTLIVTLRHSFSRRLLRQQNSFPLNSLCWLCRNHHHLANHRLHVQLCLLYLFHWLTDDVADLLTSIIIPQGAHSKLTTYNYLSIPRLFSFYFVAQQQHRCSYFI